MSKTTVQTINRAVCRTLSSEGLAALQSVATKYGLSITPRAGSFNDSSAVLKFEFAVIGESGAMTEAARDWELFHKHYGLEKDWLYDQVQYKNATYVVKGLKPRSARYPVAMENVSTGEMHKFSVGLLKSLIEDRPKVSAAKAKDKGRNGSSWPTQYTVGDKVSAFWVNKDDAEDADWYPAVVTKVGDNYVDIRFDDGVRQKIVDSTKINTPS